MWWALWIGIFGFGNANDVSGKLGASPLTGITISCQGNGRIWGTDAFAEELKKFPKMGANAVSTHPYARIHGNGRVTWRWQNKTFPGYVTRPVREAKTRGLTMMMKPHLAYWGSPFSWRGAIKFPEAEDRKRFFESYQAWIVALAKQTSDADIFVVGTELKWLEPYEAEWRSLIAEVRKVTGAKLTYAANWDTFQKVPFWDALDFIGIQAYFPLAQTTTPDEQELKASWQKIMGELEHFGKGLNKQVIFTELGYNRSVKAAKEPWDYHQESTPEAVAIQKLCLRVGLESALSNQSRVAGVFLWKWFVGAAPYENFYLNDAALVEVIAKAWRR